MRYLLSFLCFFFAGILTNVSGNHFQACNKGNCPKSSQAADLIGELIKNCGLKFSIVNFNGYDIYPLVSFEYNWSFGGQAVMQYLETYAYLLKIKGKFYYISVIENCTRLQNLYESDSVYINRTFISYSNALETLNRFDVPFYGGCTVLIPEPVACSTDNKTLLPAYSLRSCPAVKFASSSSSNNETKSAVRDALMQSHFDLVITQYDVHGEEFNEMVQNPHTLYGEPKECKPLTYITSVTKLLRLAGINPKYINTDNLNSGCLLSQGVSVGFTKATTNAFSFFEQVIFLPEGCSGITGFKIAGPMDTASSFKLCAELMKLC